MARRRRLRLFPGTALAAGAVLMAALAGGSPEPEAGVVVEKVRPGSLGDAADLLPGDVLLGWERAAAPPTHPRPVAGTLRSPFDLTQVLIEQWPRGSLTLSGRRGRRAHTWFLPGGSAAYLWQEIEARPILPRAALGLYLQGKNAWDAGRAGLGDRRWEAAMGHASPPAATWLLARRAEAWSRNQDWTEVDGLYRRALAVVEPRDDAVAAQLLRLWGKTFLRRASWERAEDCFARALDHDRRRARQSLAAAWSLTELGYTALWSGGSRSPDDFFNRALALRRQLAPGSSEMAASWYDLGAAADTSRRYSLAEQRYWRALKLQRILTPEGPFVVELLAALGQVRLVQGDLALAERWFRRALALAEDQGLEGVDLLGIRQGLGAIAERRGDLPAALDHLERALGLAQKLRLGSLREAELLQDLGLAERRAGRWRQSAQHLCQALEIGEQQRRKWQRSDDERLRFGRLFAGRYRACGEALFHLGRLGEAFAALEKGRARAFLYGLAQRASRSAEPTPFAAARRKRLDEAYDRVSAARERAGTDPEAAELLLGKQREIRHRQEVLASEPSSRLAAEPKPIDLAQARQALEPGTVLLFYSVGRDQTLLFVVEPASAPSPGLHAFSLPLGEEALRERVRKLRLLLQNRDSDLRLLARQAASLSELLLRPAQSWLAKSERILICPDGALHTLPFAALMHEGRYLIEWRPLHVAPSATAYAQIRREARPPTGRLRVAAFGDPLPGPSGAGGERALPESRREVERLVALFPQARMFLGAAATEERVKQVAGDVDLLHLAVHGVLDERLPLNSALVLSPPAPPGSGRDNGRLQAWEVLDSFHLTAELVTLSACETALGRLMDGEGLSGLSRAFQIAGARSVLASLWAVSDASTASFMEAFYRRLRRGESKDRALQAAQVEQIRSPAHSHPFYWAAFELLGGR